jgi:MoxR-like ATPase
MTVVERVSTNFAPIEVKLSGDDLRGLQQMASQVQVHPAITEYAVRLARGTRAPDEVGLADLAPYIGFGASPRASVNLILGGKALALLRGREYVRPEDVRDLAPEVLRHRLLLSYEALADEVALESVLERLIAAVTPPQVHWGDPASGPVSDRPQASN